MLNKQEFSDRVKELRKVLPGSLSQLEFGVLVGWSKDKVRNIENGRAACREETFNHLMGQLMDSFGMGINKDWWDSGEGPVVFSMTPGLAVPGNAEKLLEYRDEEIRNQRDLIDYQRAEIARLKAEVARLTGDDFEGDPVPMGMRREKAESDKE